MKHRAPFWSDDFDMDLLNIFPNIAESLGATASELVWTVGHTTEGRLNHPTVWNTHGAFLWVHAPKLDRDEHGWANIFGCVTDAPVVECSWQEWLRDCWAHTFNFVLLPTQKRFIYPLPWHFERLMWHVRGWDKEPRADTDASHETVWSWLGVVNQRFVAAQNEWCLEHEGTERYKLGTVPTLIDHKAMRPPLPPFGSSARARGTGGR